MALVVLLRGVNVGGHKTFRPARLAQELEHLGVVNVGAAGTFVVRRPPGKRVLRAEIARRLPFATETLICAGREVRELVSRDFFAGHPERSDIVRFVGTLARAPRSAPSTPLSLPQNGAWLVRILAREGRFLVGLYRRQMNAIGCLGTLDRLFGVPVTTRTWSTFCTIARVLGEDSSG
jgi:uncharacterized protein (DUF1697 family)